MSPEREPTRRARAHVDDASIASVRFLAWSFTLLGRKNMPCVENTPRTSLLTRRPHSRKHANRGSASQYRRKLGSSDSNRNAKARAENLRVASRNVVVEAPSVIERARD
jgi:hypothetical protein